VLLLGTGLLWVAGRSNNDAENAKSDQDATLAANRERSASNDPRLKGAYRYEQGGWVYVHLEATRQSRLSARVSARSGNFGRFSRHQHQHDAFHKT